VERFKCLVAAAALRAAVDCDRQMLGTRLPA
jgi:hypothetical protein